MSEKEDNILVWLPSPMGDAILCTPALRALRKRFEGSVISYFGNEVAGQILLPCRFNDRWIKQTSRNFFKIANELKKHKFAHSILFKNSFGSALACFLARIPVRAGYCRDGRGFLLTEKLYPPKLSLNKYKPISMIDYCLGLVSWLGCDSADRSLELGINKEDSESIKSKFPQLSVKSEPVIIIVPGGGFGPSKCWLPERYAQTADRLIEKYDATVIISVSPAKAERQIAEQICGLSRHKLINVYERQVSLGELKALFSISELVITNDTGPRHIATAMKCKVITLFGPNDPAWTETGYEDEIKIVGEAECVPCRKPVCKKEKHFCMESISVDMVCEAAEKLLVKSS